MNAVTETQLEKVFMELQNRFMLCVQNDGGYVEF
jgi:hypothetical protein